MRGRPDCVAPGTRIEDILTTQYNPIVRRIREEFQVGKRRPADAALTAAEHVQAVAARAVATRRIEARPDRADQAVLVQREDGAGARVARGLQRAPAERGLHVVRVHDARAGAPDGRADLLARRVDHADQTEEGEALLDLGRCALAPWCRRTRAAFGARQLTAGNANQGMGGGYAQTATLNIATDTQA